MFSLRQTMQNRICDNIDNPSETERKYILMERSYDPAQRAEDHQTPLVPLVCDIIKTPAVW